MSVFTAQTPTEVAVENATAWGFLISQLGLLPREVKQGWLGRDVCGQPNLQTAVPAMERSNSISESQLKPEEPPLFIH